MTRNPLSIILNQNKLTDPNYNDWFRNLKIVLNSEKIVYVLDKKPPREAPSDITETELAKLEKWRFEEAVNADIHLHVKELYGVQTRSERHATVKELMITRLRDGTLVYEHGVMMIELIEKLVELDVVIPSELSTDILLLSLPPRSMDL
ncbi:uncharacterized protein LOC142538544 [Primulina tabacum]|uniref:uncharacterized protein LOC142538544 n=1 Tax=Primulina tabacum TaxID=48773 RepID=UPI003F5A6F29